MNMVVRTDDGAVSLLVDEIGDVLDVDAATYERPPENLDPAARELIRGVYKLKDGCCWCSMRSERWICCRRGAASYVPDLCHDSGTIHALSKRSIGIRKVADQAPDGAFNAQEYKGENRYDKTYR